MKYLDQLKAAGNEKKVFAGGQVPPKLTKPSEVPILELTKPTKPCSVSFAGDTSATEKSREPGSVPIDLEEYVEESQAATLSPAQEAARQEVRAQLEAHPHIKRAFVNRFERDGTMILTLAIRGVGTGELKIPAEHFNQTSLDDYDALLGCICSATIRMTKRDNQDGKILAGRFLGFLHRI